MEIITKLRKLKIELSLIEGKLKVNAPEGVMTNVILGEIKLNKEHLIEYVSKVGDKEIFSSVSKAVLQEYYPLSTAQERMYFLQKFDVDSTIYNMPKLMKLTGQVDVQRINAVLTELVKRHESLRTSFKLVDDHPVQVIHEAADFEVEYKDLEIEDEKAILKAFVRPFLLDNSPLFRARIIKIKDQHFIFAIDMHHIISDGISQDLLIDDFMKLYAGQSLETLPLQYKDYAVWKASDEQDLEAKKYWVDKFASLSDDLQLPFDSLKSIEKTDDGARFTFTLDQNISDQLKSLAEYEDVSEFSVLFTVYNILISKITNAHDIVIGTPVSGRNHADLHQIVGMFVNTLPIRSYIDPEKDFKSLLKTIHADTTSAMDNQDYSYDSLVEDLKVERVNGKNPLFDIMFVFENYDSGKLEIPGLTLEPLEISNPIAKLDLALEVVPTREGSFKFTFEYYTGVLRRDTVEKLGDYIKSIAQSVANDSQTLISDIDILSTNEKQRLLVDYNNTARDFAENTVLSLFEQQVVRVPDNVAIWYEGSEIKYSELNTRANFIADKLLREGISNSTVALLFKSSVDMIAAIFGVLKSGNAYLPLSSEAPVHRNSFILGDAGAKMLITHSPLNTYANQLEFDQQQWLLPEHGMQLEKFESAVKDHELVNIIYTSGTTGQPRGVQVYQHGLANYAQWRIEDLSYNENDTTLQLTPYYFDAFAANAYGALLSGGRLVLINDDKKFNAKYIADLILQLGVTNFSMTPAFYEAILNELAEGISVDSVRFVVLGGEKANKSVIDKSRSIIPKALLYNEYGPTETSVAATFNVGLTHENLSIIGSPIANATAYILDSYNNLLPLGVFGELCIGGAGVAKGYLNNELLNKEKFIKNPVVGGEHIYKTGDKARWLSNGTIEFAERFDDQVKIRGHRIESSEVEHAINQHDNVEECVILVKGAGSEAFLAAYYVSESGVAEDELKQHLTHLLPEYMVPSYFKNLDQLPLTPNGKINKKALPEPDLTVVNNFEIPCGETELAMAEIWSGILKIDLSKVSRNQSFFSYGGNSLKATVLVNRINKKFAVEFPLKQIFKCQTIADQADYLLNLELENYEEIQKAPSSEFYPLTSSQKRLYFFNELNPHSLVYNTPRTLQLKGDIIVEKIEDTFRQLVARHEILRTYFVVSEGRSVQKIKKNIDLKIECFESHDDESTLTKDFIKPFDLSKAPLLRVGLIKQNVDQALLMVDIHHIVADGLSINILIRDFAALYNGEELDEIKLHYGDFAVWHQSEKQLSCSEEDRQFWLSQYEEEPIALDLPADFSRPRLKTYAGDRIEYNIDHALYKGLKKLSDKEGVTLFTTLFAAYNIFLGRLTNQTDVVAGIPVGGRSHADLEDVIGMFVNTLSVRNFPRLNLAFNDFISDLNKNVIACLEHQSYPYEALIDDLKIERNTGRNPLFDTMFVYEDYSSGHMQLHDLSIDTYQTDHYISKFDLTMEVSASEDKLAVAFEYSIELFERATIERFFSYFNNILQSVTEQSDIRLADICILPDDEKSDLLNNGQGPKRNYNSDSVVSLFEAQTTVSPDRIAIVFGKDQITYGQLNGRANKLAEEIVTLFPRCKGAKVGVLFEPGINMITSFLGVLKAGAAYVPMAIDSPEERNCYILEDSGAELIISDAHLIEAAVDIPAYIADRLHIVIHDATENADNLNIPIVEDDIIYTIYTSGTTGQPKGVEVKHGGISNMVNFFKETYEVVPGTNMSQTAKVTFDAAAFEIWPCLVFGGKLHIASALTTVDPGLMKKWLIANDIEVTYQSTAIAEYLLQKDWSGDRAALRIMNIAGDRLNKYHSLSVPFRVFNLYGPTEDSVWTTYKEITNNKDQTRYSIGSPIANKCVYILNELGGLQPMGVRGELCISGHGLARGYVNNDELTAQRFINHNLVQGNKLYRTGDLAIRQANGEIEFIGRVDNQIKIRGYRIELGEIESLLTIHEAVKEAVVMALGERGEKYLVAYYASESRQEIGALRKFLAGYLPEYMIPAYFVFMDKLPITSHGKVDRKALPLPEIKPEADYVAASNELEEQLVSIWSEILKIERSKIGVHSNFFELGGHSINIINLSHEINEKFECEISVANMFSLPTIAMLADYIEQGEKDAQEMIGNIEDSMLEAESNINLLNQLDN